MNRARSRTEAWHEEIDPVERAESGKTDSDAPATSPKPGAQPPLARHRPDTRPAADRASDGLRTKTGGDSRHPVLWLGRSCRRGSAQGRPRRFGRSNAIEFDTRPSRSENTSRGPDRR